VSILSRRLLDPFGADLPALQRGRYGVIEVRGERLESITLRRWPKIISTVEADWLGRRWHQQTASDRCWLYYNQPLRHSRFLALVYVVSGRDATFITFRRALGVLDEVARSKRSDAILCDAWNLRISDRLLARWGWEPHTQSRWHRNHIKRFYGVYAASPAGCQAVANDCRQAVCQRY